MKLRVFLALATLLAPINAYAVELALLPSNFSEAIATGVWDWTMIIELLFHWITLAVILSGTIAVILVMVGGYQYIFGAITENKEQGKSTITKTLIGYAVILLAWIIVDVFVALMTGP